jgi:hypothetical protein
MSYRTSSEAGLAQQATGTVETITQWDGHTMGGRVPAFMGLAQRTGGVYLEEADTPLSVPDAMRQVGLDFEVKLEKLQAVVTEPVVTADGPTTQDRAIDMPRYRASTGHFRDGRVVPFGPVSPRYQPIQPVEIAELGDSVVREAGGRLQALGLFGDPVGSRLYMAFHLGQFQVAGKDAHDLSLTIIADQAGRGGVVAQLAPIRLQCTNQTSGIFGRRHASRYVLRHTAGAKGRAAEIQAKLQLTWDYVGHYQTEAEELLAQPMGTDDFVAWEHELFGVPQVTEGLTSNKQTMIANRDEALVRIFTGPTNEGTERTRYAAAQTVIEYLDHESIVRGRDPEASRWERLMAGQTEAAKARAWNSLLVSA